MTGPFEPIHIPDWAWRSTSACAALDRRDISTIFALAQQYSGASQHRIANAVGIVQGRVSEILRGGRTVTALDVYERIADGLNMPDHSRLRLGLAPRRPADINGVAGDSDELIARFVNQSAASDDIRAAAHRARQISILAVRALGIVGLKDSLLRDALTRPNPPSLVVLLLDPEGTASTIRAREVGESVESFTAGIRLSIARLRELPSSHQLQVYLYDALPVWRLIRLDQTMYVSSFTADREGHQSATHKITETPNGSLHAGFQRVFDHLRANAQRMI